MTVNDQVTRVRIAHIFGEITGVRTAFVNIPRVLQDADLPASVVFPSHATLSKDMTEEFIHQTRIYRMVLYLTNAGLGTEAQGEIDADPFFLSVLQHFAAKPGLELNAEGAQQSASVLDAELLSDLGLQVGPYPLAGQGTTEYVQIGWDLQVTELIAITYQD